MSNFKEYLDNIDEPKKKERMESILKYIKKTFPQLKEEIRWNQPMFTDHGTFIIAFSIAKHHIAVAPEPEVIYNFQKEIEEAGYSHTKGLFKIKWMDKVDYDLLSKIVAFNIESKKDIKTFWRQKQYVNITPSPEFQMSHYKKRPWVSYVLKGCIDKEKAFMNQMNRDVLIAEEVRKQCSQVGYKFIVNDGSISIDELTKGVLMQFCMED